MGKQHNRRIFAGFYKRYDGKFIYVVAVVPDVDTGEQVVIFHEGIDACECKYYSMTKQSFCEMVEVDGEWVDKFIRQPQVRITDTHIQNLIDGGFNGPVRKKQPVDEEIARIRVALLSPRGNLYRLCKRSLHKLQNRSAKIQFVRDTKAVYRRRR